MVDKYPTTNHWLTLTTPATNRRRSVEPIGGPVAPTKVPAGSLASSGSNESRRRSLRKAVSVSLLIVGISGDAPAWSKR